MMKRFRTLTLVLALAVAVPVLPACHAPVTIETQAGKTAYTADQIVIRVNNLQNAAIQAEKTGGLPTATTRTIVEFAVSANRILKETPAGWQTTVAISWAEAKKRLSPITNAGVLAALDAVDIVLAAY